MDYLSQNIGRSIVKPYNLPSLLFIHYESLVSLLALLFLYIGSVRSGRLMMSFPVFNVDPSVIKPSDSVVGESPLAIGKKITNRIFYSLRKFNKVQKQLENPAKKEIVTLETRLVDKASKRVICESLNPELKNTFAALEDMCMDTEPAIEQEFEKLAPRPLPKKVKFQTSEVDVQCECSMPISTQATEKVFDKELVRVPKRSAINKIAKNKKLWSVHSRLLNVLRVKCFMKHRDHHLIATLATEARNWLLREGHKCDTAEDYAIYASAIQAAFLVSEEELMFRQTIKNKVNYDNMIHLNKTVSGDLGKVTRVLRENSLGGALLPNMRLKAKSLEI